MQIKANQIGGLLRRYRLLADAFANAALLKSGGLIAGSSRSSGEAKKRLEGRLFICFTKDAFESILKNKAKFFM